MRFYERAEVKDVLAYLRVLDNPDDFVALDRVINIPPRKIGEGSFSKLKEAASSMKVMSKGFIFQTKKIRCINIETRLK
jgi:DNA helicase-2/ATP-dependent DNA helicase PcrA